MKGEVREMNTLILSNLIEVGKEGVWTHACLRVHSSSSLLITLKPLYHVVSELICKWKRIRDNGRGKKIKEKRKRNK